jgi:hypothetical protein
VKIPLLNPVSKKNLLSGGLSNLYDSIKTPLDSLKPPKANGPTPEQVALERLQAEQLANLDVEENKRRKRLLLAVQGPRAYAGSPLLRAAPSNTAGAAAPSAIAGRGGGGGGAYAGGGGGAGAYPASLGRARSLLP